MREKAPIALGLVLLVLAVFHPVLDHAFVNYDDPLYVTENPMLRGDLEWSDVARAFRPYETNWIPLTWISLAVDHAFHGMEPAGYHATNIALHSLGTLLLFAALTRLTGAVWRSAFVAAVFAVHPLHVESVAWASERKDVLSGAFWMLAMWAWAWHAERPGAARMAGVAICLALGLLAKPVLVTLPFALLLLDHWPLGRLGWRAAIEKWPLFALVVVASAVTFVVQRETGAMLQDNPMPLGFRLANAIESYWIYLVQSAWPSGLAVFYPHPLGTIPLWHTLAGGAGLAAITGLVLAAVRSRPYLTVGWLWYLGTLVPVIGLVQVGMQAHADRYMYVPLIGLSLALAWGVAEWAGAARPRRIAAGIAAAAAIAALSVAAFRQVGTWADTTTLYARAVSVTERNFLAHHGLANALLEEGRGDEAETHFAEAVRLKPRWAGAHAGVGDLLLRQGDVGGAITAYRRALELAPRNAHHRANLGRALIEAGRSNEAAVELQRALRNVAESQQAEVHAYLGLALIEAGRFAYALRELSRAESLGLESVALHLGVAEAARRLGRSKEAVARYRAVLALNPGSVTAANNLGWILATDPNAAVRDAAAALEVAERLTAKTGGNDPALLDTLAAAQAAAGQGDEAARTAARAAELARARGDTGMAIQIETRRSLYAAGVPYIEETDGPDRLDGANAAP